MPKDDLPELENERDIFYMKITLADVKGRGIGNCQVNRSSRLRDAEDFLIAISAVEKELNNLKAEISQHYFN